VSGLKHTVIDLNAKLLFLVGSLIKRKVSTYCSALGWAKKVRYSCFIITAFLLQPPGQPFSITYTVVIAVFRTLQELTSTFDGSLGILHKPSKVVKRVHGSESVMHEDDTDCAATVVNLLEVGVFTDIQCSR
jgi:hypothetical protein